MVELATVWNVEAPRCHFLVAITYCDAQSAGLDDCWVTEGGLAREINLVRNDRKARSDGDAIPLVQAVHDHLITGRLEGFNWELLRLAFNFLHRKDVDVGALKESDDAVDASADLIDVPSCKPHGTQHTRRSLR